MQWLHTHFSQDDMVRRYADIILNARKQPPMPYRPTLLTDDTRFKLAPWCYLSDEGEVYHDFQGEYLENPADRTLLQHLPVTMKDGAPGQVDALYRAGYLVPLMDQ